MALTWRVRIAFATDPFAVTPTWTDVSQYLQIGSASVDITRGTGDQDTEANPSILSLTLVNNDGRFTVGYTGGAYYPNVVIGKRIRVDATMDGTTYYPRFDGYLDSVPVQWAPAGRYAEAQITAVDRLKKLGKQILTRGVIETVILSDSPQDYWKLGDADKGQTAQIMVNTAKAIGNGAETVLRVDPTKYDKDTANTLAVDGITSYGVEVDGKAFQAKFGGLAAQISHTYTLTNDWSVECWFRFIKPTIDSGVTVAFFSLVGDEASYFLLVDAGAGLHSVQMGNSVGGGIFGFSVPDNVYDEDWHHLLVTYHDGGFGNSLTFYRDGVSLGASSIAFPAGFPPMWLTEAAWTGFEDNYTTQVAHLAIYEHALTSARPIEHTLAGTGYAPEDSATRFTRAAAYGGVVPVTTGTASVTKMGPLTDIAGQSVLSVLEGIRDTEGGVLFTQTDGDVQFVPRGPLRNPAAQLTLTAGQYGTDLQFLADDSTLINDAIATPAFGDPQHVTNATSITAMGTYSVTKDLNTVSEAYALHWAQWAVNTSNTNPRVTQVTVDLMANQSLLPAFWSIDIAQRIDLAGLPTSAPASTAQLLIAGCTESYSANSYTVTFNTTQLGQAGWVLDDAALSILGTSTRLAY